MSSLTSRPRLPRTLLFFTRNAPNRAFSRTPRRRSSPFTTGPAPPRLPKEEQEVFERLQKGSRGAFSTPREEGEGKGVAQAGASEFSSSPADSSAKSSPPSRFQINQSPDSDSASASASNVPPVRFQTGKAIRQGEEVHPNMRRGAPPEFEGDVNPKTGEVGGPKNEPLRWGASADWSYNGRVTDF